MLTIRQLSRLVVFACLAPVFAAATAEDAPALRLEARSGSVDVLDARGCLVQSLPFDGEQPDADNREFFAVAEDMDFDGHADVRVLYSRGMVNLYYDFWLWRPDAGAFVRIDGARKLSNPNFDAEQKRIYTHERGSAVAGVAAAYEWQNGKLTLLEKTVRDATDDGEYIVVRRYLRDRAGTMRLVAEDTRTPEQALSGPYGEMDDAYYRPVPAGLNLIIGPEAADEVLDVAVFPNGEWWIRRANEDRTLLTESRRLPARDYGRDGVLGLILTEWPEARRIRTAPFPALAEKLSYPAYKATFLEGHNEDTTLFAAALVFADEWSFWTVLQSPADDHTEEDLEKILLDIRVVDPAEGDFLPAYGLPAYLADENSPLDVSVMDALVRIKKIAGPENSQWIGDGNIAYRYDGSGTVADRPALLFSFGADSWEKFTAERHFAVDEAGTVYEMRADEGPEYWRLSEYGAPWWGRYAADGRSLCIGNYREGPAGMFFDYTLADSEAVIEGLAVARGRTGRGEGFAFTLAEDGESIEVRLDGEPRIFPDSLEGVYVRE